MHAPVARVDNDERAIGQECHIVRAGQLPRSLATARHRPHVVAEGIVLQDLVGLPVEDTRESAMMPVGCCEACCETSGGPCGSCDDLCALVMSGSWSTGSCGCAG